MKVLVTGVNGQLGHDIVEECQKRNIEAIGVDVKEMDITDAHQVNEVITETKPDAPTIRASREKHSASY